MSVVTHAPGPWEWYWRKENKEADCGVFYMRRPGHAYAIARCPRYEKREQWEANARLIVAAPTHHNLLRKFNTVFRAWMDCRDDAELVHLVSVSLPDMLFDCDATLTKAEGVGP